MASGDRYGRYTVLGVFRKHGGYQKYAKVQCDCGSDPRFVQVGVLRNGTSQSCGCLHREIVTRHGHWNSPLRNTWGGMKARCYDQKNRAYRRYGARGITICPQWKDDFLQFFNDMSPTYSPGLTLDRIDNNGPYSPENCRWATRYEQNRNYSRNVMIAHDGKTMCAMDWANLLGINYGTLWDRINVQKIDPSVALTMK